MNPVRSRGYVSTQSTYEVGSGTGTPAHQTDLQVPATSNGMNVRVLWALIAGFFIGVLLQSIAALSWPFVAFVLVLALASLAFTKIDAARWRRYFLVATGFLACALGMVRTDASRLIADPVLTSAVGSKIVIEGVVTEEADVRESNTRLTVDVDKLILKSSTTSITGRVLVIAPPHTAAAYGARIRAEGELRFPEAFDATAGREFNYPMFLAKDGILYELSFAAVEKIPSDAPRSLMYWPKTTAIWIKQKYLEGLHAVLPEPEASLAGGITVGDKRSIGKELSEVFQKVSLIHIIVLSGYNITIVINALQRMLGFTPRILRYIGIVSAVVIIVLMTGGAASAMRAGAMALIAVYARATGRLFIALRVLGVVAVAMLVWNPLLLLYDPGFQLSIIATLGLILFTPLFAERLQWIPAKGGLREIVSSTLGTQLAVLPLLLYQTGSFSIVALPANLLVLVAIPPAMFFTFVGAIAGVLFGSYAIPFGFPALILLAYMTTVAELFASLPFASVTIPAFGGGVLFILYALLTLGYLSYQKRMTARS